MNSTWKKKKKVCSFGRDFWVAREISAAEMIHAMLSILT